MIAYLLLPILLFCVTTLSAGPETHTLLKVEDGDTLVIDLDGDPTRIQLLGIDAPEDVFNPKLKRDVQRTGKTEDSLLDLGRRATSHLQHLVAPGTKIIVEGDLKRKDKYGRIPVTVSRPGGAYSLNEMMVQQGYAIMLGSYSIDSREKTALLQFEKQARTGRIGLWESNPELMEAWSGRPAPE